MNNDILKFIQTYADAIDNNEWDYIYDRASLDFETAADVGQFTQALIEAGINPLEHLTYIPTDYLCGTDINTITIPDDATYIGSWAFSNTHITAVMLPKNIKKVFSRAFADCKQLTTVLMQSGVELLSSAAFKNCINLTTINFPATLTDIKENCFGNCVNLPEEIYLPEGLEKISELAFNTGSHFTRTIFLPRSLKYISAAAFDWNAKLIVHEGSYAHHRMQELNYDYEVIP